MVSFELLLLNGVELGPLHAANDPHFLFRGEKLGRGRIVGIEKPHNHRQHQRESADDDVQKTVALETDVGVNHAVGNKTNGDGRRHARGVENGLGGRPLVLGHEHSVCGGQDWDGQRFKKAQEKAEHHHPGVVVCHADQENVDGPKDSDGKENFAKWKMLHSIGSGKLAHEKAHVEKRVDVVVLVLVEPRLLPKAKNRRVRQGGLVHVHDHVDEKGDSQHVPDDFAAKFFLLFGRNFCHLWIMFSHERQGDIGIFNGYQLGRLDRPNGVAERNFGGDFLCFRPDVFFDARHVGSGPSFWPSCPLCILFTAIRLFTGPAACTIGNVKRLV